MSTIRTLPFGTGLILLRAAPPVIAQLRLWIKRADAAELHADRAEIEARLHQPFHGGTEEAPVDPGV